MEKTVSASFGFLKVLELQWNSHLCILTCSLKIETNSNNFKNGTKTPKMANFYSHKILFAITLKLGRKPKTYSEQSYLASGCFMNLFCNMTSFDRSQEWLSYIGLTVMQNIYRCCLFSFHYKIFPKNYWRGDSCHAEHQFSVFLSKHPSICKNAKCWTKKKLSEIQSL